MLSKDKSTTFYTYQNRIKIITHKTNDFQITNLLALRFCVIHTPLFEGVYTYEEMSLPQVVSDLIKASKHLTLISLKERLMYLDLLNSLGQYNVFSKFLRELSVGL